MGTRLPTDGQLKCTIKGWQTNAFVVSGVIKRPPAGKSHAEIQRGEHRQCTDVRLARYDSGSFGQACSGSQKLAKSNASSLVVAALFHTRGPSSLVYQKYKRAPPSLSAVLATGVNEVSYERWPFPVSLPRGRASASDFEGRLPWARLQSQLLSKTTGTVRHRVPAVRRIKGALPWSLRLSFNCEAPGTFRRSLNHLVVWLVAMQ